MKLALVLCVALLFIALVQAQADCTPGQTKMQDCNGCKCTGKGKWSCTRKGCLTKRDAPCEPGTTFKKDCNTCVCPHDDKPPFCTLIECEGGQKRDHMYGKVKRHAPPATPPPPMHP